ncbi:2Fe-2S iron-sulfur cluster-binding protein [Kitasatospora sp. LaBMicrA B282]|uniref:2Fe-2S iron-sulfur cluster-binding protein n=1 Tax=Kitasatospora sp. LaBMicrA B282 TaxID=3420949 RepID=UPI003D11E9FE
MPTTTPDRRSAPDTDTAPPPARWHQLTVAALDRLTADTTAITLAVPAQLAEAFRAPAGRHLVVRHRRDGRELRRSYSLCPPPFAPEVLRLIVKRAAPDGFGVYAATELAVGDRLEVSAPTGGFRLAAIPGGHHVLLAGGTGIAPLLAMAAAALREDPHCRVSLVYSVQGMGALLLADELTDLKDAHLGRFTVLPVFSREPRAAELLSGRIDAARLHRLLAAVGTEFDATTAFYLCGPWGLVATARDALTKAGAGEVRLELFSPEGTPAAVTPPPAGRSVRVTARLAGHTSSTPMQPGDRVLLDAVLRARPDAPYSCQAGLCGSCRAKVVAGSVALGGQFALGPAELAAGYTLTCRARPQTDAVELDFDA